MCNPVLQVWKYHDPEQARDQATAAVDDSAVTPPVPDPSPAPGLSEEEVAQRIRHALVEAERRYTERLDEHNDVRNRQLETALRRFAEERTQYYRQTETEVVQLALAISRKVLARETQLDPDWLAALVRIALDRMGAGTQVRLRVPPAELAQWQQRELLRSSSYICELLGDAALAPGECVVETDLGTANFGLESQLKQVEEGVLELLRLRPEMPHSEAERNAALGNGTV